MRIWCALGLALGLLTGCSFYRRQSTPVAPIKVEYLEDAPENVYTVHVVGVSVSPRKGGGLPWDDDKSDPDITVRFIRNGETLFETPVVEGVSPEINYTNKKNYRIGRKDKLKIEVRDDDQFTEDWVGDWKGRGLPRNALQGTNARYPIGGGNYITLRVDDPQPYSGTGLEYEVRKEAVRVVSVVPQSPASRAGIKPGDDIIWLGNEKTHTNSPAETATQLALASQRKLDFRIRRGTERVDGTFDDGYIWVIE